MRLDVMAALRALPGFPELASARVRLRGARDEDTDAVFALYSAAAVMRYWSRAAMAGPAEAAGLIIEDAERFSQRESVPWVIARRDDDLVIGTCSLFHFDGRNRRAEIGYALHPDHWGRGLATEAVSLAIGFGFRGLALHRIEADIDPRNEASRRLLRRLGFVTEGRLRERFFDQGKAVDAELHGLLARDWEQLLREQPLSPKPTTARHRAPA